MTNLDERWLLAWHLLSLERVKPFWPAMWVNLEDENGFVTSLRRLLGAGLQSRDYYRDPGRLHCRIARWVLQTYGAGGYMYLRDWMFHIFVAGGPDRRAEAVWSALVQRLGDGRYGDGDWVERTMANVRKMLNDEDDVLEASVSAAAASASADWDGEVVPIHYSDAEAVDRRVTRICSYNNVLLAWARFCGRLSEGQLAEVHDRAITIASEIGWQAQEIPFPGNWMFDLAPFIRAAENRELIPVLQT